MSITKTETFKKVLAQLRALEYGGLCFQLQINGESFSSRIAIDSKPKKKHTRVNRSFRISDLVRDRIDRMEIGDVELFLIPSEHKAELTLQSWRSAITAEAARRLASSKRFSSAQCENGIELFREE